MTHTTRHLDACSTPAQRGSVLIVTMWIVVVLASLVLMLAQSMRVEGGSSANIAAQAQADAIEYGAIQYVLAHVDGLQGMVPLETDMPTQGVRVGDGAFWIIRPDWNEDHTRAYGLIDEAAKVNLNTASLDVLSMLPQMNSDLAASIVDWRDPDQTVTTGGAESQYYMLLPNPYNCKDAPLETIEELLMVKDFTRDILYGEDTNQNYVLDTNEDDADASDPPDNHDGRLQRGLADFVTVYTSEPNTDADGKARTNINTAAADAVAKLLGTNLAASKLGTILSERRRQPFKNVFDFKNRCKLTSDDFLNLADQLTTRTEKTIKGLININTAPHDVLLALPGLDESDVTALLSARPDVTTQAPSLAWVADALKADKAAGIGDLITSRSYQFSANIVSVAANGRSFRRCRVVVDASSSPPKVIYRQDLTGLGWPLEEELMTNLRAGVSLDQLVARTTTGTTGTTSKTGTTNNTGTTGNTGSTNKTGTPNKTGTR
jgi:type II secretory pathway component PulK